MKSHFTLNGGVAVACAVAGASTMMMNGNCSAGTFIVSDYATNSTYNAGWSAGQNGGYGLGPWSFDGTVSGTTNNIYTNGIPNPGDQQTVSSGSAIGTAWTLFNNATNPISGGSGISDVGRAIPGAGGLQPGQTFHTVIQNPTAYHYYGGFDILFFNGTNNLPAGVNTAALRLQVFNFFVTNWKINDANGNTGTPLQAADTGAAGMTIDLTLTSATNYSLTMTPLNNPSAAYVHSGTLASTNLPINYVNYRLYNTQSSGPSDTADNFEIGNMTIQGLLLNIQLAGANAVLSWPTNSLGVNLAYSFNLGANAAWTNILSSPVVINGQNVVTNPITGTQLYYRLQQ